MDFLAHRGGQFIEDYALLRGEIVGFGRIGLQVVKLKRSERTVLQSLPRPATKRIDGFSTVQHTSFTPDEIEVARPFCLVVSESWKEDASGTALDR